MVAVMLTRIKFGLIACGNGVSTVAPKLTVAPAAKFVPLMDNTNPAPSGTGFVLSISGTNFAAGATVSFGATVLTPFPQAISPNLIRVNITATMVASPGTITVSVTNPGSGGTSNSLQFLVK